MNIWKDKPKEEDTKYYVRWVLPGDYPDYNPNVICWIVDSNGNIVTCGALMNKYGGRYSAVNPQAARRAGIELDDEGRWKLPEEVIS